MRSGLAEAPKAPPGSWPGCLGFAISRGGNPSPLLLLHLHRLKLRRGSNASGRTGPGGRRRERARPCPALPCPALPGPALPCPADADSGVPRAGSEPKSAVAGRKRGWFRFPAKARNLLKTPGSLACCQFLFAPRGGAGWGLHDACGSKRGTDFTKPLAPPRVGWKR